MVLKVQNDKILLNQNIDKVFDILIDLVVMFPNVNVSFHFYMLHRLILMLLDQLIDVGDDDDDYDLNSMKKIE